MHRDDESTPAPVPPVSAPADRSAQLDRTRVTILDAARFGWDMNVGLVVYSELEPLPPGRGLFTREQNGRFAAS